MFNTGHFVVNLHSFRLLVARHKLVLELPLLFQKKCLNETGYIIHASTPGLFCRGMAEGIEAAKMNSACSKHQRYGPLLHFPIELIFIHLF